MNTIKHYTNYCRRALCLLPVLLLTATSASAQTAIWAADPHDAKAFVLTTGQKTAAALPRIISYASYIASGNTLIPIDSSQYSYTGKVEMSGDQLENFKYSSGMWEASNRYLYTYNADLNTQTELQVWSLSKKKYSNLVRYNYTYNAAKAKTGLLYEIWNLGSASYINGLQEVYTLDAANNLTGFLQQIWNVAGAAWTNNERITQTYNAQNQVTDYILELWNSSTNLWINKTHVASTYDASGLHMLTQTTYSWDRINAVWQNAQQVQYVLTTAGKAQMATTELYNIVTGNWDPSLRESYTYNAAGDYATRLQEQWDNTLRKYSNYTNTAYSYNSNDQLTVTSTSSWVSGTWTIGPGAAREINYYEGGNDTQLGVPAQSEQRLSIYPVPAAGLLHISLKHDANGQDVAVSIVDMQGQMQTCFSLSAAKHFSEDISVASLPAGNYILYINDGPDNSVRRLITVAH